MKCRLSSLVVLMALAVGCTSNGTPGTAPDPMQIITGLVVSYGGQADLEGDWHSPTAEPGNEQMHVATILVVQSIVAQPSFQPVRDFAQTPAGSSLLLTVANSAACPVCKGILQAAGWTLIQDTPPTSGLIGAVYHIERAA